MTDFFARLVNRTFEAANPVQPIAVARFATNNLGMPLAPSQAAADFSIPANSPDNASAPWANPLHSINAPTLPLSPLEQLREQSPEPNQYPRPISNPANVSQPAAESPVSPNPPPAADSVAVDRPVILSEDSATHRLPEQFSMGEVPLSSPDIPPPPFTQIIPPLAAPQMQNALGSQPYSASDVSLGQTSEPALENNPQPNSPVDSPQNSQPTLQPAPLSAALVLPAPLSQPPPVIPQVSPLVPLPSQPQSVTPAEKPGAMPATTIDIRIGRIEIRAAGPPPVPTAARPRRPGPPTLSLSQYLQRGGRSENG